MKVKAHLLNHFDGDGGGGGGGGGSSGGESGSPSPPSSPRRPSRAPGAPHCRRIGHRRKSLSPLRNVVTLLLRRHLRVFLLLPLCYFSGLLVWASGTFFVRLPPSPAGSLYRSPQLFRQLWPHMHSDNASAIEMTRVWTWKPIKKLEKQKTCQIHTVKKFGSRSGYLIIEANGGLNQQRSSICNAVALAGLLNAILVIPKFHFHSIWQDPSEFKDIYDEDHFISTLQGHVRVIKKLPKALLERFDYNISNIPNLRVKAWAPASYYLQVVYPLLLKRRVIRISPFANRLSVEVPSKIQSVRCLANYQALRFSVPITVFAQELVNRMVAKSSRTGGKYVSVHLRFEKDMVAFSCCEYDGGKIEKTELDAARELGWRGKFSRKGRIITPGLNRVNGKCPLTPLEVGMMLRGMGFDNSTSIYLAAGEIYQAERNLVPLLQMFPLLQTKETLSTPKELTPFKSYSSRLAALDYTVCLYSEVFVTTQGGNFPHFLMGHRRYMYNGHAKTIKPDKRKIVVLLQDTNTSWNVFKEQMKSMLIESDRKGIVSRKPNESIYLYPIPECKCYHPLTNSTIVSIHLHDASGSEQFVYQ